MPSKSEEVVRIPAELRNEIRARYGGFFHALTGLDPEKITDDVLSPRKIDEQVALIERMSGERLGQRKVLEIGSGFGIFVIVTHRAYGADAHGVEPGSEGFGGSYELSRQILEVSGVDPARIVSGVGESLPYADDAFDIVYSTNVLEHVRDPARVLAEAIRVCRPGGFIQIVVPNFGSFFDGHYACFYLPYQPKWLWKWWLRAVRRRDPAFADTLRTELNYWTVRKILKPYVRDGRVHLLGTGEDVFWERMATADFTAYGGLGRVKVVVDGLTRLGLVRLAARMLLWIKAHSPLIISLRKMG